MMRFFRSFSLATVAVSLGFSGGAYAADDTALAADIAAATAGSHAGGGDCAAPTATPSAAAAARGGAVLLAPHGGGPMPLLDDEGHRPLIKWLSEYPAVLKKTMAERWSRSAAGVSGAEAEAAASVPADFSAIIVFSAHWEESVPTITGGANPSLIYDYYGFPKESYSIKYPAKGDPQLAKKISAAFTKAGIINRVDNKRGWDHGVFVPLKLMYPAADVPVVQVSLVRGLDPLLHVRMGEALRSLVQEERVLLLGSGFTFHNMNAFFGPERNRKVQNEAFEKWLKETCASGIFTTEERRQRLVEWEKAPHARYCHPREEHLMPLHVCFGAAPIGADGASSDTKKAEIVFDDSVLAKTTGYLWM